MLSRRPAFVAALVAAALVLAAQPASVRAAGIIPQSTFGIASYELTNNTPPGTAPVQRIVANVDPAGSVVPPPSSNSDPSKAPSPLTILPGSSGFDQHNLQVSLGSGQTPAGAPLQALALDFGPGGFAPGGVLNFSLSLAQAFQGTPTLQLPDSSSGLSISALTTPPPTNQQAGGAVTPHPESPGGGSVPEPASLALWSLAVLGLGLARARRHARRRLALD